MKKILLIATLLLPGHAIADYMDVIEFKLNEGCSFEEYMEIVNDFNATWGEQHGYSAQVAVPIQSDNLVHMYWVGTTANAAAFGKAWDAWRDELKDPKSTASKLWERFQDCETNLGRWGYDVY
jgi:hypothetical protein